MTQTISPIIFDVTGAIDGDFLRIVDGIPTWAKYAWTESDLLAALNGKEPIITPGLTGQYWRGDKTWATLNSTAVGLGNVDNTADADKPLSAATIAALAALEPIIVPGMTTQYWRGDKSWATLDKAAVGLNKVDNTSDAAKPISAATLTALANKEPAFALGSIAQYLRGDKTWATLNSAAVGLGNVDNTSDLNKPVSTAVQTELASKEPAIAEGTVTDYWRGDKEWAVLNSAAVGLGNVDNTADADKPISTAVQSALAGKESTIVPGTVNQFWRGDKIWVSLDKTIVGLANVDNTADIDKPISTATQTALAGKEPTIAGGTITQFWRGDKSWATVDKTLVGLDQVDNTSDADKPISTAVQTALSGKEPTIAGGTITQFWRGDKSWATVDKTLVGLDQVDNTSDADKPISAAVQTALAGKESTITAGTTAQYWRGDKTWVSIDKTTVGLDAVDNTADIDKPISTAVAGEIALITGELATKITQGDIAASGLVTAPATLLGRTSPDVGAIEQITIGTGLILVGGELSASVSGDAGDLVSGTLAPERLPAFSGDVSSTIGSSVLTIGVNKVTLAMLAKIPTGSFLGRANALTGDVEVLTAAEATDLLSVFTTINKGLVPPPASLTGRFLKDDGSWSIPTGGIWGQIMGNLADQTDLQNALLAREPIILAGTVTQYLRGDKTWATLDKTAVGLGNIDNTSDANKPVSTATANALATKAGIFSSNEFTTKQRIRIDTALDASLSSGNALEINAAFMAIGDPIAPKTFANGVGIKFHDTGASHASIVLKGTSLKIGGSALTSQLMPFDDDTKVLSLDLTTGILRTGTNTYYHDGNLTKATLGLGSIDNTSDFDKPVSLAQQIALNAKLNNASLSGRLLGRSSTGSGPVEFISLGTGLHLSNGTLSLASTGFSPVSAVGTGGDSQIVILPKSGLLPEDVLVSINGVLEDPSEYSITGNQLTLYAPEGTAILIRKPAGSTGPTGPAAPLVIANPTTDYVLEIEDRYVRTDNALPNTITVPLSTTVPFEIGVEITILQAGPGTTTIAAEGGVVINTAATMVLSRRYGWCKLVKVASDEWDLFGDLA